MKILCPHCGKPLDNETINKITSGFGKQGGDTTLKTKGKDFYKEISKKAVEARWGKKKDEQSK